MSFDNRSQTVDVKFLDDLGDSELIEYVHDFHTEMKRLTLENTIYEKFLMTNEPTLIASMAQTLEIVKKMQVTPYKQQIVAQPSSDSASLTPRSMLSKTSGYTSDTRSVLDMVAKGIRPLERGPRINFSQKTDLVMREIEGTQVSLKKFMAMSHRRRCKLQAEIEECSIREQEVKENMENFEQVIVKDAVEKLTQKIPAEKFIYARVAEDGTQTRLKILLDQKEELGECVHEVDFEKLKIENRNFQIKIEQKNSHLLELKQINAKANLMLTNHKKLLQKQDDSLKTLKKNIKGTQRRIQELEEEDEVTQMEVLVEKERYKQLRKLVRLYQVPDVLEYVRKKVELDELHKNLKIWNRKTKIKKTALSTYTRMMKNLTGATRPRASWYDINRNKSEDTLMEDYVNNDDNTPSEKSFM